MAQLIMLHFQLTALALLCLTEMVLEHQFKLNFSHLELELQPHRPEFVKEIKFLRLLRHQGFQLLLELVTFEVGVASYHLP